MLRRAARCAGTAQPARSSCGFSTGAKSEHWLHARFPRLSARLDGAAHASWLRGLSAAVRASPAAVHEHAVLAAAQERHGQLLQRHAARASDRLAATHVAAAARVGATAAALAPDLRDAYMLRATLRDVFGLAASPLTRSALAAALLFAPQPRELAVRRRGRGSSLAASRLTPRRTTHAQAAALRALQRDYGQAGFAFAPDAAPDELVVTRCLYADVFAEEEAQHAAPPAQQLLAATCCSLDTAVWFDLHGTPRLGDAGDADATPLPTRALRALRPRAAALRVELTSSIARGDSRCCMRIVDDT